MVEYVSSSEVPSHSDWERWEQELKAIGVTNPLQNFEVNAFGQIDLERSHPGGFSQFVTGRQTLLSNLVRDPLAFSRALSAARRIKNKSDRISDNFGIETLFLVGGLANFEADGFDINAPILMWPVSLIRKGDDYEVSLTGDASVNPVLAEALETAYGIKLNAEELLARQRESSDLVPVTVLNYLANLTADKGNLDLRRILVISNFTTAATDLLSDISRNHTPLLAELAGEPKEGLEDIDVPELNLVVEADATQMRIVARAQAGQSFAVETLPGCGYTQTVVNVVAGLVDRGKRVLVVAPRRQTLGELAERFATIGLPGLGIRSDSTWVDLISAISRNEKAVSADSKDESAARVAAEQKLDSYFDALNSTDPSLGVSVARVLRELSSLSGMSHPPLTNARIAKEHLLRHVDRSEALQLLNDAHALGEFRFGPQDTAWFQARFESPAEVEHTVRLAKNVRDNAYPKLAEQLETFTSKVNFKPAVSVEDWGLYLRLFVGIRETLDRFVPDVFDRPLTELIAATAPRKGVDREQRSNMSGGNRRRLKKLAREYLRAGMHVADMHASLNQIQEQRELWQKYCLIPTAPQVPIGIQEAQVAYQAFMADLETLQSHMDPESDETPLAKLPLMKLQAKLESLAEDSEALENLGERALLGSRLREAGLGQLARNLAKLHVAKEHLAQELEQAWWQSALEVLVSKGGSVLSFSAEQIAQNEAAFRRAHTNQIANGAAAVASKLADRWHSALKADSSEAAALKALLKTGSADMLNASTVAPKIWAAVAPVVMVSPFDLPKHVSKSDRYDVLIVLDAAGSTVAENLGALSRADQVITFGDDAVAAPGGFEIENRALPIGREYSVPSVFAEVRRIFGAEVIRRSYRTTSQTLGDFINREFYQNRILYTPTAAEYFGENNFVLDVVSDGNRAKTTIEGATESLDSELDRTVELVFSHATWHPEQSLLVASASSVHAERIRAAVQAGLKNRPQLEEYFDSHGREKFEVTSIAELSHRVADRIIFSLGYGRTSHGAVLSNFGQLSETDGRRYLANLLVSARKQITLVSCFGPDDLPTDRLSNGAVLLGDLFAAATAERAPIDMPTDPMLQDLSLRLKKLGARVDQSFSKELPLVVAYAKTAAVIDPDWAIPGSTRTEKFHIRPGLLTSMGWKYIRVYSFELFSDPQKLANRIAEELGLQITRRPQPLFDAADRAFEDTDLAWGDRAGLTNDQRLQQDKPPHWG
ncbi:DUF4011 domain-containing protein [Rhodoluna limnophila]|uniref:DUF4011 domain-containing protein n=1 Tax=Rhodoluna limnophila TaxID=232537 RepID=UPI0011072B78|nr:DUF4011 domain-containing protein [Rhodoluna limnophila]